jgi:hypothetical protein
MKNYNLIKSLLILCSLFALIDIAKSDEGLRLEKQKEAIEDSLKDLYEYENIEGLKFGGGLHFLSTTPTNLEDYKKDFGDSRGFFLFFEKGFIFNDYIHLGLGLQGSRIEVKDKESKRNEERTTTIAEAFTRIYLFPIRDKASLVRPFLGGKYGKRWVSLRDFRSKKDLGKSEDWVPTFMAGVDFTHTRSRISFHVDLFGRKSESGGSLDEKGLQLGLAYLF